jgi:hypothetical protein
MQNKNKKHLKNHCQVRVLNWPLAGKVNVPFEFDLQVYGPLKISINFNDGQSPQQRDLTQASVCPAYPCTVRVAYTIGAVGP